MNRSHLSPKKNILHTVRTSFFSGAGMVLVVFLMSACARQLTMNSAPIAPTDSDAARQQRQLAANAAAAAQNAKKPVTPITGTSRPHPTATPTASPGATPSATPQGSATPAASPGATPSGTPADGTSVPPVVSDILADDNFTKQIADYQTANNMDCSTSANQIQYENPGKTGNFTIYVNCVDRIATTVANTEMVQLSTTGTINFETGQYTLVDGDLVVEHFSLTK
jgi:hypothetical protein